MNGLKVYVSPNVAVGTIALGVNQGALQASAGVEFSFL